MIIFLYGKDTYRAREKLKEIVARYQKVHQNSLNLKIYDDEDLDFRDFKDNFQQTSIFREKKLFILKNVFSNQNFKESVLKEKNIFLKSDDIIVFFQEGSLSEKDRLAVFLKENGKFQKFELLRDQKLRSWLREKFEKEGLEIETRALERLIDFVGDDSWRMNNEIKKLSSYKAPKGVIREKDVSLLVKPKIETDIFKTIEALAQKDKKKALRFVEKHLEKGDSPFYILSMINYQFRNLLLVKTKIGLKAGFREISRLSRILNIHPYPLKKAVVLARFFSLPELKKAYQNIFETDLSMKTGKINPEEGLKMLIAQI